MKDNQSSVLWGINNMAFILLSNLQFKQWLLFCDRTIFQYFSVKWILPHQKPQLFSFFFSSPNTYGTIFYNDSITRYLKIKVDMY